MVTLSKRSQYTVAKLMHWTVALVVVLMLMSGWRTESFSLEDREWIMMIHSGLGTTIFFLMLYRWWWRRSHNLYTRRGWQKKPSLLIRWAFYPLLLLQPVLGFLQATRIDYQVLAFGLLDYSALAVSDQGLFDVFHTLHAGLAIVLILILLVHVGDISRRFFIDDTQSMKE